MGWIILIAILLMVALAGAAFDASGSSSVHSGPVTMEDWEEFMDRMEEQHKQRSRQENPDEKKGENQDV